MLSTYSPKCPLSRPLPFCLKAILCPETAACCQPTALSDPYVDPCPAISKLSFALEMLHVANLQPLRQPLPFCLKAILCPETAACCQPTALSDPYVDPCPAISKLSFAIEMLHVANLQPSVAPTSTLALLFEGYPLPWNCCMLSTYSPKRPLSRPLPCYFKAILCPRTAACCQPTALSWPPSQPLPCCLKAILCPGTAACCQPTALSGPQVNPCPAV